MHPALKTGPVAIYARYSSERQDERSIDDQVRRCREYIAQQGGNPDAAKVFPDFAISGASLDRPGFEAMMAAVNAGAIKAIVTEDMSRISRDFADSALIFKRLQFKQVPLVGVADGIDTSEKHAKLSFTVKSLVADLYLDDLRDKTLRGLEGRALAGFATGNVAYGYHTVPVTDEHGTIVGNRIEIHEGEAKIIVRIFQESSTGRSLTTIAHGLNKDGVPSPRVGTRHKCFGWGSSTIRAILYNERYAGVWKFKERQWVKVPGTNKRQPRPRNASEVISQDRPELRIVDRALWDEVQGRLARVRQRYAKGEQRMRGELTFKRAPYLFSGLLVCRDCGAPMTMMGGLKYRYYRCQANKTKGICPNTRTIREDIARPRILDAIRERLLSPEGVAHTRRRIAEELRDYSQKLDAELRERKERLKRTEEKMAGLVDFIATGDRSQYVITTLRDLEQFTKQEREAIAALEDTAREPLRLPSIDEVEAQVRQLDHRLQQEPEAAREQLRRWLKDGVIRTGPREDGAIVAEGALLPLMVIDDGTRRPKRHLPETASTISGRYTVVAGALSAH
jgi:site-specific DNA recombinase